MRCQTWFLSLGTTAKAVTFEENYNSFVHPIVRATQAVFIQKNEQTNYSTLISEKAISKDPLQINRIAKPGETNTRSELTSFVLASLLAPDYPKFKLLHAKGKGLVPW